MSRVIGDQSGLVEVGGPYSPSVRIGRLVAVSGQCGYLPGRRLVQGIEEQTDVALANLQRALASLGCSLEAVLSVNVYLTEREHFSQMNARYANIFSDLPRPARTTVYTGLGDGVLVEFDCIAVRPE